MTLHYENLVFCWHQNVGLQNVYLLVIWCWKFFYLFIFHMNKIAVGFLSLYLGMSSIYATSINVFQFSFNYVSILCMFCNEVLWNCSEAKLHCYELLALFFEIFFGMSRILALIRWPTRISHLGMIIIGHSILPPNHWFIYSKHMVHEKWLTSK